jgi:signal transduction histidine kinase/CheY-like chemotaxis protein
MAMGGQRSTVNKVLGAIEAFNLNRPRMLTIYLVAVGLNSLVFYLFPPGYYDRNANLFLSILCLLLLPTPRSQRLYPYVVQGLTVMSALLVLYIASQSGGINSNALVWLTVLAVPVLLLLGPRATVAWIGVLLLALLAVWAATAQGPIHPTTQMSAQAIPWAMMNHALALISLMVAVYVYDHLNRQQQRSVDQRNADLQKTHEALILAQAHKDEFVAAVGHELRTPMNAILGFNGVLRQELADRPEQVEIVDHIRRSTSHLLQVVNDILDFSQLQAGRLQLHLADLDLAALLSETVARHQERAREKGLFLQAHTDVPDALHVRADRQRLQQVLNNLLDNAIKFTAQGRVDLRVRWAGARLRFEVQDTGRGIAPDRQAHIFHRFEHADVQTNRAYGGTGLGLTLCERLVQLQGGEIGVHSQPGQGAQFWFELPLAVVHPALPPRPTQELPSDEPLHILLVDDNAVNLMVAQLQLRKIWPKANISSADGGPQALRLLDAQTFDLALVDMIMPGMDGMQLTQQARTQFGHRVAHMPIIALTANTHPTERERCLAAGMDAVLHKPIDSAELVRVVSALVWEARA